MLPFRYIFVYSAASLFTTLSLVGAFSVRKCLTLNCDALVTTTEVAECVQSLTRRMMFSWAPIILLPQEHATAVVMEQPKEKAFEVGVAMGSEEAKARFQEARKTLNYLIDNYDVISKAGGDNVRRYLGTVGTTSALYGITKVMKELQDEVNDVVEFTENMQDFYYYLRAADTAVYSANFVEFSAATTKPEKFFADAKSDCVQMKSNMDNMAAELSFYLN